MGGCHNSTLFPSGSMTQANLPYSESSILHSRNRLSRGRFMIALGRHRPVGRSTIAATSGEFQRGLRWRHLRIRRHSIGLIEPSHQIAMGKQIHSQQGYQIQGSIVSVSNGTYLSVSMAPDGPAMQRVTIESAPSPGNGGRLGWGRCMRRCPHPSLPPQLRGKESDRRAFTGIAAEKQSIQRLSKCHSDLPAYLV